MNCASAGMLKHSPFQESWNLDSNSGGKTNGDQPSVQKCGTNMKHRGNWRHQTSRKLKHHISWRSDAKKKTEESNCSSFRMELTRVEGKGPRSPQSFGFDQSKRCKLATGCYSKPKGIQSVIESTRKA